MLIERERGSDSKQRDKKAKWREIEGVSCFIAYRERGRGSDSKQRG